MPRSTQLALAALVVLAARARAGAPPDPSKSQFAVQWTGLSKACQGALAELVDNKSDISQCSRVGKLFNQVVSKSAVDPEESLLEPLNEWLGSELCAKAACEASIVSTAYKTITEKCSTDLEKQRWIPMAAQGALMNYETGRTTLCLRDSGAERNATSYCPIEVLNNVESSGTPITYKQGQRALSDIRGAVNAVPTWTFCQPCSKGLLAPVINVLQTLNPDWAAQVQGAVDGKCGAGFANGETPASLEDGITFKETSPGNGTNGGADVGAGDGEGGFDNGSTGFKVQSLTTSVFILVAMALLAMLGL